MNLINFPKSLQRIHTLALKMYNTDQTISWPDIEEHSVYAYSWEFSQTYLSYLLHDPELESVFYADQHQQKICFDILHCALLDLMIGLRSQEKLYQQGWEALQEQLVESMAAGTATGSICSQVLFILTSSGLPLRGRPSGSDFPGFIPTHIMCYVLT